MPLIDITPPITPALAVFPGDTPPRRETLLDMAVGAHLTLSTLHATVHLGAHVDGANHYGLGAPGVDAWPLERFVGPCAVIHVPVDRGTRVTIDAFERAWNAAGAAPLPPRVLLRTGTYPNPDHWNDDFAGLEPDLVDRLHACDVVLVGIDTPSVDLSTAKYLDAHHRFLFNEMTIIEGLVLSGVDPGFDYELIALPLRLVGYDASPVRAVLRTR